MASGATEAKKGEPTVHTGVGIYHYIRSEEAERLFEKMIEEGEVGENEIEP